MLLYKKIVAHDFRYDVRTNEALRNVPGGPPAEFILIVSSVVVFRPGWTACLAKFDFCLSSSFVYLTKLDPLMDIMP